MFQDCYGLWKCLSFNRIVGSPDQVFNPDNAGAMLELREDMRFYIFNGPVNMRGGYGRLCSMVIDELGCDPRDPHNVYIFINRTSKIIRMLHYESGHLSPKKLAVFDL